MDDGTRRDGNKDYSRVGNEDVNGFGGNWIGMVLGHSVHTYGNSCPLHIELSNDYVSC